ncbi:MAG: DUF1570 domain-containing protein [Phycisphaerae bacterium]|jgi:hypothetical protein|nr:DUF1570 domain-containing protein [Phycisphaerae bacterium]MCZ2401445.1 DUF1570 domain-containing protein [Phycisphaerae bacterium]NUQ50193.1 DUF1570 domain-containing protein [Phycisphaerae bacterium]
MRRVPVCLTAIAALGLALALGTNPLSADESKGRYRIVRMDGKQFEGNLTETADAYVIEVSKGINVTIRKNQVKEMTPLDGEAPAVEGAAAGDNRLSDEEIARILGSDENFAIVEELAESSGNAMSPSPVNEESIAQMTQLAGDKAETLETAHFLLVYTSSRQMAQELGARLESIYAWNVRLMNKLGLPAHRPDHKLEMFFFGTHAEFERYAAYDLGMSGTGGILGFYMPPTNRSAFFDMSTFPPYANALRYAEDKDVPLQRRREVRNKVMRMVAYQNLEVIQHEAAHHIHCNIGMFNRRQNSEDRWLTEGMAVQFEVPPTRFGASLGAINHERLRQLLQIWKPLLEADPPAMDFWRAFLWQGTMQYSGAHYSLGWAVVYYLRSKHEAGFAKYMLTVSQWEDDVHIDNTERQKLWEDSFGELNEKWIKDFAKFILGIQLRTDELPPDDLR